MKKLILLCFILLAGCSIERKRHTFEFYNYPIEVNTEINTCKYVKSIDGIEITDELIKDHQIILNEKDIIDCTEFSPEETGQFIFSYRYDRNRVTVTVRVVDTTEPTIYTAKDIYEVEVNNDYFDIKNEVKISDNYDKEFFSEIHHSIDLSKEDEYEVLIKAKDNSGNQSTKKVIVKVIPKEKEIIEVPKHVEAINNGSNGVKEANKKNESSNNYNPPVNTDNSNHQQAPNNNVPQPQPQQPSGQFINGVHDITIPIDSDLNDMVFQITSGISASGSLTVDYSSVNLSVAGQYVVFYYSSDGASASSIVNVVE